MCLIVVCVDATPRYPLIVGANRDEQHARPSAAAAWWRDSPHVLGGRDLKAGGTWLAVDRRGRFGAVTNIRDLEAPVGLKSRGMLVAEYLHSAESAEGYAARAMRSGAEFGAFNLLVYDGRELHLASNRTSAGAIGAGIHSFSNAPPGVEWPKTTSVRAGAERLLSQPSPVEPLFALLAERSDAGYQRTHFVVGTIYGTRCSTVVLVSAEGRLTFAERTFDASGQLVGEIRESVQLEERS
jgi:uncharacterized protein with NRDE domain